MHSLKRLISALIVALMMTSCSSSPSRDSAQQQVLPAEYSVPCQTDLPAPADNSADATALTLKTMYDLYGTCAGRFIDLINWITKPK